MTDIMAGSIGLHADAQIQRAYRYREAGPMTSSVHGCYRTLMRNRADCHVSTTPVRRSHALSLAAKQRTDARAVMVLSAVRDRCPQTLQRGYRVIVAMTRLAQDHHAAAAACFSIMSAAFSPIMIEGALVLPEVSVGMIEASATRSPVTPRTCKWSSTTAIASKPILQVPTGW